MLGALTLLCEQAQRRGSSRSAVDPHDDRIFLRLAPRFEKVEEQLLAIASIDVAGVGAARIAPPIVSLDSDMVVLNHIQRSVLAQAVTNH